MKSLFLLLFSGITLSGCIRERNQIIKLAGEAQGTTYHIAYFSGGNMNYKEGIDSILKKIDSSLSTYLPVSIISRINKNDSGVVLDDHFMNVYTKAREVSERAPVFDITVAPIINAWGFGFSKKEKVDSALIDSLLPLVGYKMVKIENNSLMKEKPGIMLDFNAIAQGYTVDVIAEFLEKKGISKYFIELGGEVMAKGVKSNQEYWKVGIDKPVEENREQRGIQTIFRLYDRALATSGNYRKFYEENGQKYSHIIDPATGYPAKNNLLSASVFAADCMTADAYATTFMVMGLEKSKEFLSANKELELQVYFIYDNNGVWETYISDDLKKWMETVP